MHFRLATLGLMAALIGWATVPSWAQAQQPSPAAPGRTAPVPARSSPAGTLAPAAAPAAGANRRLDINSASQAQLDSLPGVGPARAKAIIAGRPYTEVKDLETKSVLPAGVLSGLRDRVALANINTSSAADLQRTLPGIGDVRAKAIVAQRPYASPADLVTKKVLAQGVLDGIMDIITY